MYRVLAPVITFAWAFTLDSKAREGIAHYIHEEYNQASAKFQASQLEQPDNAGCRPTIWPTVFYRLGRYEDAVKAYKKSTGLKKLRPTLKTEISITIWGTPITGWDIWNESIDAYKKALELNPGDTSIASSIWNGSRKQLERRHNDPGRVGSAQQRIFCKSNRALSEATPTIRQTLQEETREHPLMARQENRRVKKRPNH